MKEIDIVRHATKDATGALTDEGKNSAETLATVLGSYDIVISSPKPRAVETATLLTGKYPVLNERASALDLTARELKDTHEQGKLHQFGIAGVLFDSSEYRPKILKKGKELMKLIEETFSALPNDGRALIISHDGVMVAAYMIMRKRKLFKAERTFTPLQGFQVFENGSIKPFEL